MKDYERISTFVNQVRRRLLLEKVLKFLAIGGSIGFGVGLIISLVMLWVPLYHGELYAYLAGCLGLAFGLLSALLCRPKREEAALYADAAGLEESLITALELEDDTSLLGQLQRERTARLLNGYSIKESLPFRIPFKEMGICSGLVLCCFICSLIPTLAKDRALALQEIKELVEEQEALIEEVKEELKEEDLSAQQQERLDDLLSEAMEEMAQLEEADSLEDILERLDLKLDKEVLEDEGLKESAKAISEKLNLPSAAENKESKEQTAEKVQEALEELTKENEGEAGESLTAEELKELSEELTGKIMDGTLSDEDISDLAGKLQADKSELKNALADISDQASASLAQGNQQEGDASSASGSEGTGQGGSQGEGSGSSSNSEGSGSSGNGSGSGSSSGNGSGSGSGQGGTGWNTGSKNGFERVDGSEGSSVELEIPDKTSEDENLTGTGNGNSSYVTDSNGSLTWSGESIDYNSIIEEYTSQAYSQLEKSSYPAVMKDLIKNYFSELNGQ